MYVLYIYINMLNSTSSRVCQPHNKGVTSWWVKQTNKFLSSCLASRSFPSNLNGLTFSIITSQTAGVSYAIHPGSKATGGPSLAHQQVQQMVPLTCSPAEAFSRLGPFSVPLLVQVQFSVDLPKVLVIGFIVSFQVPLLACFRQSLFKAL